MNKICCRFAALTEAGVIRLEKSPCSAGKREQHHLEYNNENARYKDDYGSKYAAEKGKR